MTTGANVSVWIWMQVMYSALLIGVTHHSHTQHRNVHLTMAVVDYQRL